MPRGFTRNSYRRGCCSHTVSMRLSIEKVRFVARPAISLTTGYYFFVWETFRHSFKGTNVLSPPNIHARRADGVVGVGERGDGRRRNKRPAVNDGMAQSARASGTKTTRVSSQLLQ